MDVALRARATPLGDVVVTAQKREERPKDRERESGVLGPATLRAALLDLVDGS